MEGNLHRSSSNATSLTAENCKDRSDNCTVWTDEKHSSYLNLLESSFVKRLHQSKGFAEQFPEKNHGDMHQSQKRSIGAHNSSEQFTVLRNGSWQKLNYKKAESLSHASADSHAPLKSPWIYRLKHKGLDCHPPKADIEDFLTVFTTPKHEVATSSMQRSPSSPFCAFPDVAREGTGQNFSDEDDQNKSSVEPEAKRVKEALAGSSCQDQIVPTTDYSATVGFVLER